MGKIEFRTPYDGLGAVREPRLKQSDLAGGLQRGQPKVGRRRSHSNIARQIWAAPQARGRRTMAVYFWIASLPLTPIGMNFVNAGHIWSSMQWLRMTSRKEPMVRQRHCLACLAYSAIHITGLVASMIKHCFKVKIRYPHGARPWNDTLPSPQTAQSHGTHCRQIRRAALTAGRTSRPAGLWMGARKEEAGSADHFPDEENRVQTRLITKPCTIVLRSGNGGGKADRTTSSNRASERSSRALPLRKIQSRVLGDNSSRPDYSLLKSGQSQRSMGLQASI